MNPALLPALTPLVEIGARLIDKLIPDKEAAAKAKLELLQMEQAGELEELRIRMSAILAEANSEDKWTSRARPSFLYVVYTILLMSIPMGVIHVISPPVATQFTFGFQQWFAGIPEQIIELFGFVMLGYIGGRSYEKATKIKVLGK